MGEMTHSVESTTAMKLCVFDRSELWSIFRSHPTRAFSMTWLAAVEEHLLGETVATLGQRDATERISWALARIYQRLDAIGLANQRSVPLPFRQQDLADALGLSLVHTNKTLARLRERQLAQWQDGQLTINDLAALAEVAMISLENPPVRPLI
jgi:CRP-like cAMP-binding protein